MSLTKCKKCGEMYADSYKTCPFCAEDARYYNGRVKKTTRRPTEKKIKRPSAVGPVLILAVLLILAALAWIIFGGHIGQVLGDKEPAEQKSSVDTPIPEDVSVPEELPLDQTSILLTVGSSETLHVEGEENVEWSSSDPTVAAVTSSGAVKGLAEGSAIITARCDDRSATCSVSVTEEEVQEQTEGTTDGSATTVKPNDSSSETTTSGTTTKPDSAVGKVDLSNMSLTIPEYGDLAVPKNSSDPTIDYDISIRSYEQSFHIEVQGVTGKVTWSSSNTGVVTVSSDGAFTRVAAGSATVTGKIGTETFTILVRCQ